MVFNFTNSTRKSGWATRFRFIGCWDLLNFHVHIGVFHKSVMKYASPLLRMCFGPAWRYLASSTVVYRKFERYGLLARVWYFLFLFFGCNTTLLKFCIHSYVKTCITRLRSSQHEKQPELDMFVLVRFPELIFDSIVKWLQTTASYLSFPIFQCTCWQN